jgi:dTDP-4-amino-4,6-dideoxygalactose transaminase
MFYLVTNSSVQRNDLLDYLNKNDIYAFFHYQSLHTSYYFTNKHDGRILLNCDNYSNCLIRLPFYYELTTDMQAMIVGLITNFFEGNE